MLKNTYGMNLIPELFGYSNKNPYLCIVIDKNR